jgi:hypothetical protein
MTTPHPRQYLLVGVRDSLPTATDAQKDQLTIVHGGSGNADTLYVCRKAATGSYEWLALSDSPTFTTLTVNNSTTLGNADNDTTTIMGHLIFDGTAPTITAGTAAGAGATITRAGTDGSFRVTLTTGAGAGEGTLVTVTFAHAWSSAEYEVVFSAGDGDAALNIAKCYVDVQNPTVDGFAFLVHTPLADNTSFRFNVHVHGGT